MKNVAEFQAFLTQLIRTAFQYSFEDWNTMFGFEFELLGVKLCPVLGRRAAMGVIDEGVVTQTRLEGSVEGQIHFAFPQEFISSAVVAALMLPQEGVPEPLDSADESKMEAVQELMNLFCGSSTRAFEELIHHVRVSQSVEHLRVSLGTIEDIEEDTRLLVTEFETKIGDQSYTVRSLLREDLLANLHGFFKLRDGANARPLPAAKTE